MDAKITFTDSDDREHILTYKLFDGSLQQRWVNMIKANQAMPEKYIFSTPSNITYKNIDVIKIHMARCLERINDVYDEPLPTFPDLLEYTTQELNDLHALFERYGDRRDELIAKAEIYSADLHDDFLELNETIHKYEDALRNKGRDFPNVSALFDYYPQGIHESLTEDDKEYLTGAFEWGGLYLGYNTLGKDWMDTLSDRDADVIERDQVRPQIRFAAEAWVVFNEDQTRPALFAIKRSIMSMSEEVQRKIPIANCNNITDAEFKAMTYGRFQLGRLVIDSDFKQRYGWAENQEITRAHKATWSSDVFTTFRLVTKIEIV